MKKINKDDIITSIMLSLILAIILFDIYCIWIALKFYEVIDVIK